MKTRSRNLMRYIVENGGVEASPETIAQLRKDYRREYKKNWRHNRQLPIHELRPTLTKKQYEVLKYNASLSNFPNPTSYARSLLLNDINDHHFIVNIEVLMLISQKVGMAINTMMRGNIYLEKERILEYLNQAEAELLRLIHSQNK